MNQESTPSQASREYEEREAIERRNARAAVRDLLSSGLKPTDPSMAKDRIEESLVKILEVASTSKNIKGSLVKRLKDAVEAIQGGVRALTSSTAMDRLLADNARMSRELEELRGQVGAVQQQMAPATPDFEKFAQSIMRSVGTMMDAKLASLEGRLPPEPILRPPLAADRRRAAAEAAGITPKPTAATTSSGPIKKPASKKVEKPTAGQAPATTTKTTATGTTATATAAATAKTTATATKKKPTKKQSASAATSQPSTSSAAQPMATDDGGWAKVVGRKAKRREAKKNQPAAAPKPQPAPTRPGAASKAQKKRAQRQRAAARKAAVVITIDEEQGFTYAEALTKARQEVNVAELGIDMSVDPIRIRRTQTGARVLELPKSVSQEAADKMADQLRAIYGDKARVSRPIKCAELRVSDLDDSVTKDEILAAVARQGKCAPGSLSAGELRLGPGGKYTIIVKCPLTATPLLVTSPTNKFLVGWSSARVVVLKARPLKCFRCLALGHTKPLCACPTDRSGQCYRCGATDHKAAACKAPPKCAICTELGRNAHHQIGSRGCAPPALTKRLAPKKAPAAATLQAQQQPCAEEMMETV